MSGSGRLDRSVLTARPERVAPLLLGCLLVAGEGDERVVVRIDEVEAYGGAGEDPGSHAHRGPTARNAAMFADPGLLYVYFTYGMHWCANVVAHEPGQAGAVLVRAGEVVQGGPTARGRRAAARSDRDLARGPARLTQAMAVVGDDDGLDLLSTSSRVRLLHGAAPERVACGPRVGVSGPASATRWRWWDEQSRHVSAYRAASSRPRRGPATPGGHA